MFLLTQQTFVPIESLNGGGANHVPWLDGPPNRDACLFYSMMAATFGEDPFFGRLEAAPYRGAWWTREHP